MIKMALDECDTLEITIGAQVLVTLIEVSRALGGTTGRLRVSLGRLPTTTSVELRKPRMLMRPSISPIGRQC
jgi:hypothetical protein